MTDINTLVAQKVMKWHEIEGGWGRWYNRSGEHVVLDCDWSPSTHIDDAMKVHSEMRLCILPVDLPDGSHGWQVRRWSHAFDLTSTNHKSLCMAICLCALRVCGVPELEIQEALT